MVIVLDIDGTLANNDHRAHYVDGDVKDWENFLRPDLVIKDTPIARTKDALKKAQDLGYTIVFLTGRNESLRDTTMRWLFDHYGVDANDETLYMRPIGNLLKPTEYKHQQLTSIRRDFGNSLLFVDDDKYMHKVYAEFGLSLKAPECWDVLFPEFLELEEEVAWRK